MNFEQSFDFVFHGIPYLLHVTATNSSLSIEAEHKLDGARWSAEFSSSCMILLIPMNSFSSTCLIFPNHNCSDFFFYFLFFLIQTLKK